MRVFPFCHWNAPDGPSVPTVNITSVTLPYFGGSYSGVGGSAWHSYYGYYFITNYGGNPWGMSSTDGETWTQRALPATATNWSCVAAEGKSGGKLVIGVGGTTSSYMSTDAGASWSAVTAAAAVFYSDGFTRKGPRISAGIGTLKCGNFNGTAWPYTSASTAPPTGVGRSVSGLSGSICTPKNSGTRYTLATWNPQTSAYRTSPSGDKPYGFYPSATDSFYIVFTSVSTNYAYHAPDPPDYYTAWISRTLPTTNIWNVVGGTSNWIMAFKSNSENFIYSDNGIDWYSGVLPTPDAWSTCISDGTSMMLFSSVSQQAYKITIT